MMGLNLGLGTPTAGLAGAERKDTYEASPDKQTESANKKENLAAFIMNLAMKFQKQNEGKSDIVYAGYTLYNLTNEQVDEIERQAVEKAVSLGFPPSDAQEDLDGENDNNAEALVARLMREILAD